jgi:hypothetical protein
MKRPMMYFFLALVLCGVGACGKGEQEIAPEETPQKEIVVKEDTVKQNPLPPVTETPCEKDSTPITFEKVDIAMGIIKELAPKDPSKPYDYPLLQQPFYIIINSAENELYKKLVTQEGKPIPSVDFEKNSLIVAGLTASSSDGLKDLQITKVCKDGRLQAKAFLFAGVGAAFTPVNFSFLIPKVNDKTEIEFNIIY